jgi:hypothetical protein
VAGLLALKATVSKDSCIQDPRIFAIFDTWQLHTEPCQLADCKPCLLEHPTCGVYQAASNGTTCLWRYVECKNSRVAKVLLGEQL